MTATKSKLAGFARTTKAAACTDTEHERETCTQDTAGKRCRTQAARHPTRQVALQLGIDQHGEAVHAHTPALRQYAVRRLLRLELHKPVAA